MLSVSDNNQADIIKALNSIMPSMFTVVSWLPVPLV